MICSQCQSENPDDTQFCGKCAAQLSDNRERPVATTAIVRSPRKDLSVGSIFAGRYQIIEKLGKGGMGKVYKVWDREVEEKVALKLLNPQTADDEITIERFRNELKLARKISHRNVCRMFDLSREEETHYITMEYVPGEDLKSSIRRMGPLSVGKAIAVVKQICQGLAEAHDLGVVHRDLKPQNVMVDKEGNARIMDFGIARSLTKKGITETGVIIGTPEYMSVEQVEGKEADQRSDIYSLGVILYEMLTGSVPFDGDTPLSIAIKHTNQIPADPRELNAQIPEELSRVVLRCMEKEREERYQSVEQLLDELSDIEGGVSTSVEIPKRETLTSKQITFSLSLKKILIPSLILLALAIIGLVMRPVLFDKTTASVPALKPSLAILPFDNNSGDERLDYWRSGLSELLTADLRQSRFLRVLNGETVFEFLKKLNLHTAEKHSPADLKKVAAKGRVDYILKGSFFTGGENITIVATLENPRTQRVISSRRVECEGEAQLPLKIDELTMRIKSDLRLSAEEISRDIDKKSAEVVTGSPEAYRYYIQGRKNHFDGGPPERTIQSMQKAISLDSEFALAYRTMAEAQSGLGSISAAWNSLKKASELEDRLTARDLYLIRGELYSMSEQTYDEAIEAYNELLEVYPQDGEGNLNLGLLLCYDLEQYDKAIERFETLIRGEPETSEPYVYQAEAYMASGMYDRARGVLESCLTSFPQETWVRQMISHAYLCQGGLDLAQAEAEQALSVDPTSIHPSVVGDICHCRGDVTRAEREYQRILEQEDPASRFYGWSRLAALYLSEGKFEKAEAQLLQASALADQVGDTERKMWLHLHLAQLNLARGKPNQAVDEWRIAWKIALAQDLDLLPHLHLKGLIALQTKSIEQAENAADQLKKTLQAKRNKKLMRYYHHLAGMIELAEGDFSEAISCFERAISLLPSQHSELDDHAMFLYPLALAYYRSGNLQKAQEHYKRIISLTTGRLFFGDLFAKSFYMLGRIYDEKGLKEEAMAHYRRFIQLWAQADTAAPELARARERVAREQQQS